MSKIYSKGFEQYWARVKMGAALWRSPIKHIAFNAYKAGIVQAQLEEVLKKGELEGGFVGDHLREC